MKLKSKFTLALAAVAALFSAVVSPAAKGQEKKPNILVIMGDDVGWYNIGAYHQGIMSGKRRIWTSWRQMECDSPIITPRQVAPPGALILSLAKFLFALG